MRCTPSFGVYFLGQTLRYWAARIRDTMLPLELTSKDLSLVQMLIIDADVKSDRASPVCAACVCGRMSRCPQPPGPLNPPAQRRLPWYTLRLFEAAKGHRLSKRRAERQRVCSSSRLRREHLPMLLTPGPCGIHAGFTLQAALSLSNISAVVSTPPPCSNCRIRGTVLPHWLRPKSEAESASTFAVVVEVRHSTNHR